MIKFLKRFLGIDEVKDVVCKRVYIKESDFDNYCNNKLVICSEKKNKNFNLGVYPNEKRLDYRYGEAFYINPRQKGQMY